MGGVRPGAMRPLALRTARLANPSKTVLDILGVLVDEKTFAQAYPTCAGN